MTTSIDKGIRRRAVRARSDGPIDLPSRPGRSVPLELSSPRPVRVRRDRSGGTTPVGAGRSRRDEIVAAAIRVIARDGLRACTVTALEHETGFARGHFTYHFRSKEEIIGLAFATVASDWATTQMSAPIGGSARAALEHRVRAAVTWVVEHPEYFRCLMNFRVEMMRNPAAFPVAPRIRHQMWEFTAQLIRDAIAQGDFRSDLDADVEARVLFATIDGFVMHAAMDPAFHPHDSLADHVWTIVVQRLAVAATEPS